MAKATLGFPTRKAAEENTKRILREWGDNPAKLGTPITGLDAEFVERLLRNHPSAAEKIGSGIAHHFVARDDTGGKFGRGFRVMRTDGTNAPWSWPTAMSGKPRVAHVQVKMAMRDEVRQWMEDAGREYDGSALGGTCLLTGKQLEAGEGELHHDGDWPFHRIALEFMRAENLGWDDIVVERAGVGVTRFADRTFAERWRGFHARYANIIRVHADAHKGESKGDAALRARGWYDWLDFKDNPLDEEAGR